VFIILWPVITSIEAEITTADNFKFTFFAFASATTKSWKVQGVMETFIKKNKTNSDTCVVVEFQPQ
jgi:hypothetical protein